MTSWTLLTMAAFLGAADERSADRELLARAAQEGAKPSARAETKTDTRSAPAAPPETGELTAAEAQAQADLLVAQARVDLIQARKALQAGRNDDAQKLAQRVIDALDRLPREIDASVYELQAEGILARVSRTTAGHGEVTAGEMDHSDKRSRAGYADADPFERVDDQARASTMIARRYSGADVPYVDAAASPETLRDRAIERQVPHKRYGYRPAEEIVDIDGILERDTQRYFYEHALDVAVKFNEADRLTHAEEARIAPESDVAYPDDWQRKVAKRAKYKDGVIARSPSWKDKDGREWYMAVYDIHDLIYEAPDFIPKFDLNAASNVQTALNMDALRYRSEIFGGYADDLAAGIPLLRYFGGGGIDDLAYRGPKYNLEKQREIVEMIRRFTGGRTADPAVSP